jgi:hypothetical protein
MNAFGFATSLLGAQVRLEGDKLGKVVAVYPSSQGFGLVLMLLLDDGTLQESHSSGVAQVLSLEEAPQPVCASHGAAVPPGERPAAEAARRK